MSKEDKNPVLCHHHGFEIRKYNQVNITLNDRELMKAIDAHVASGKVLSIAKIIALQGAPCQECGHDNITLIIPKSIISIKKGASGGNISSHKKPETNG